MNSILFLATNSFEIPINIADLAKRNYVHFTEHRTSSSKITFFSVRYPGTDIKLREHLFALYHSNY